MSIRMKASGNNHPNKDETSSVLIYTKIHFSHFNAKKSLPWFVM